MDSKQNDITPNRSTILVSLVSVLLRRYFYSYSLYKPLFMKNKCKMVSMLKRLSLSGDISIMKGHFVTKFFSVHYLSKAFRGFSLNIELVVFVYELIIYL